MHQGSSFNFMEASSPSAVFNKNIVVPYVPVITEEDQSREGKYSGLSLKGAFQREGDNVFLQLLFSNNSNLVMQVLFSLVRTLPSK